MPFITQGKTNWKFLVIVIVLAVIVVGGALWYAKRPPQPPLSVEVLKSKQKSAQEQACLDSGGTVSTTSCCKTSNDFPNSCLIGACGCSPTDSHEVKTCNCVEGKCFNGTECVAKSTEENTVGVKVGDWVMYKNSLYNSKTNQNQNTNPIKAEVTAISGSNVTTTITEYYKDGHTAIHNETKDISKEIDGIASPNLNVGDSRIRNIPESNESFNLTVSQILTKSYNGTNREVVYFDEETPDESVELYYDRKTGFLLESYVTAPIIGEVSIQLDSTNLW